MNRAVRRPVLQLLDSLADTLPDLAAGSVTFLDQFAGALVGLFFGVLAVLPDHQARRAPNVDFRNHGRGYNTPIYAGALSSSTPHKRSLPGADARNERSGKRRSAEQGSRRPRRRLHSRDRGRPCAAGITVV